MTSQQTIPSSTTNHPMTTPSHAHLLAHIQSSQTHPTHTSIIQSYQRFQSTTLGSPTHFHPPRTTTTGLRVLYIWPVSTQVGVSTEWRRWEAHLNRIAREQTSSHATATDTDAILTASPLPPVLPATVVSTGNKWTVQIEHCFLQRSTNSTPSTTVTASKQQDEIQARVARVTFHSNSILLPSPTPPSTAQEQWLLTHNSILCGIGLHSWLDSLGSDFVQVKAVHQIQGDEYVCGDFIIRIGTMRLGARVQPCMIMDIEYTPCSQPSVEACQVIHEFAIRLGVPPEAILAPGDSLGKNGAIFGLSTTHYSLGHTVLQYYNLINRAKELLSQHQQPASGTPVSGTLQPQSHPPTSSISSATTMSTASSTN